MSDTDFSSLYSSGDIILQNPIESSAIFLVVVVMCSSIEYLFSLAGEVDSKFFRTIFDTISEEVLVVGVLSLLLTFGSSVILQLSASWTVMFQWAHICLLFMGIMFVVLLSAIMFFSFSANSRWKKFELGRMRNNPDGFNAKEQDFSSAVDKFRLALKAYGYPTEGVPLSVYLLKAEKKNLVELGNLSWKSWLALSTIVVLNALRTQVITQLFPDPDLLDPDVLLSETGNIVNVAVFILVCGYGTLGMFFAIHRRLSLRYKQYLMLTTRGVGGDGRNNRGRGHEEQLLGEDDGAEMEVTRLDLDDPQSFLLWQSWTNSIALVQIVLMFLVWYSAVFFLNIVYQTFSFHIGLTMLFIVAAFVPLVVFVLLVPSTMTAIAVLSTLGTNLNENWVKNILKADATNDMVNKGGPPGEKGPIGKKSIRTGPQVEFRQPKPLEMDEVALHRLAKHHSIKRQDKEQLLATSGAGSGRVGVSSGRSESVIL